MVVMRIVSIHDCMTVVECSSCGYTADLCLRGCFTRDRGPVLPVCVSCVVLLYHFFILSISMYYVSKDNSLYIQSASVFMFIQ